MPLPGTGDLNWGGALNDYIVNTVQAMAEGASTNINTHTTSADPHGSQAYTDTQISAITVLKGAANGYAELGVDGRLAPSQAPAGGGRTNAYDVKKDFGATGDGSTDDTAAIQAALNECAIAGGGEVWIPNGTYIVTTLQIKAPGNLWIHLSNGAVIKRKASASAQYLITNFNATDAPTAYSGPGQLMISGGTLDGNAANNATSGILLGLAHASGVVVRDMIFQNVTDWNAVVLGGCNNTVIETSIFRGFRLVSGSTDSPAVKIATTLDSSEVPGLAAASYDSTPCVGVVVNKCASAGYGTYGAFGAIVSSVKNFSSATLVHSGIRVNECTVYNSSGFGIRGLGWTNSHISRNVFRDCNGMVLLEVPASRPVGSNVDGTNIIADNIGTNVGTVNAAGGPQPAAISLAGRFGAGANPASEPIANVHVTGNQIINWANVTSAIYVLNGREVSVSDNTIVNGTNVAASAGITVHNSFYTKIVGNRVKSTQGAGIYLTVFDAANPGAGCAHSSCLDNIVSETTSTGISINYSSFVLAGGNNLQNTTTAGIGLYNSSGNCLVNNNVGQNCGIHGTQYQNTAGTGNQLGGAVIG